MSNVYTATIDGISVSAAGDLLEIAAAADSIVRLMSLHATQEASENSEMLDFSISRAATSGSGGSSVTAIPLMVQTAAFGGTVERNNSTPAGTLTQLWKEAANMLTGWHWQPIPESFIIVPPSGIIVVRLDTNPAAALTFDVTAVFEELG